MRRIRSLLVQECGLKPLYHSKPGIDSPVTPCTGVWIETVE